MASHQGGGVNFDFNAMDFGDFPMSQTAFTGLKECGEGNTSSDFYFGDEGVDTSFGQQSFDSLFTPSMNSTSFGLEQPLCLDNTSGGASWNNVPTSTLNSFPPTPVQSFDALYDPKFNSGSALGKRPLQLDVNDFPQSKRHETVTGAELAFSPYPASASVTGSSWAVETQPTPSSSTEMGLSDEAADVCATWFGKYNVLPSDRHIDSLSQLTGEPQAAIRHWFGQALKTGLGGHDSAYKSQTGGFTQESILNQLPGSVPETAEQPTIPDLSCFHDAQTSAAPTQPALRGGRKGCNPTDDPELLRRDPNKVFQCTRKCGKRYGRKCDWKRNEEEGYPSKSWICSLCIGQGIERVKPCFRKYHFSQHFRNVHPGVDCAAFEETSTVHSDTEFPRRCGFCPHRFVSRQDRIDHIANHFQRGKCMLDWNDEDNSDSDNVDDDGDDDNDDGRPDSGGFDSSKPFFPPSQGDSGGSDSKQNGDGGTGPGGQRPPHGGFFQFQLSQSESSDTSSTSRANQHIKPTCITGGTHSAHEQYDATEGDDSIAVAGDAVSEFLNATTSEACSAVEQASLTAQLDPPEESLKVVNALELTTLGRKSGPLKLSSSNSGDFRTIASLLVLRCLMDAFTRDDDSNAQKLEKLFEFMTSASIGRHVDLVYLTVRARADMNSFVGNVLGSTLGSFDLYTQYVLEAYQMLCRDNLIPHLSPLLRDELIPHLSPLLPPPLPPASDNDLTSFEGELANLEVQQNRQRQALVQSSSESRSSHELSTRESFQPKLSLKSTSPSWLAAELSLLVDSISDRDPVRPLLVSVLEQLLQTTGIPEVSMSDSVEVTPLALITSRSKEPQRLSCESRSSNAILSDHKELRCSRKRPDRALGGLEDSYRHYEQHHDRHNPQLQISTQMQHYWNGITTLLDSHAFLSVKLLGTGGFSTVDEVVHRETSLRICRKTLKNREHSALQELKKEVNVLQKLRHPHVIRFLGAYSNGDKMSILLSPVAETTLAVWLDRSIADKPAGLSQTIVKMLGCLSSTIRYLHEQRPVVKHMDIKPENILVMQGSQEFPHVVLSDFGISSVVQATSNDKSKPLTRHYCAPEVSDGTSRGQAADIWSLGCVFAEMATAAYSDENPHWLEFRQEFRGRNGKYYWQEIAGLHDWLTQFMDEASSTMETTVLTTVKSMLNPEPDERPDAAILTMIFAPAPCCLCWPNDKASFPGPREERRTVEMLVHEDGIDCHTQLHRQGDDSKKPQAKSFAQANDWLEECSHDHEACRQQPATEKVLPTRLIDIKPNSTEGITARIVNSAQLGKGADQIDYVAISHEWSSDDFTLSTDRLKRLQSGLSREVLPQAINEAISAAEQIGYRYLWVDSLCVLQDSEEDKERECLATANVYRNAALTIVLDQLDSTRSASPSPDKHNDVTDIKPNLGKVWSIPSSSSAKLQLPVSTTLPAIDYLTPGFAWDTRAWSLQDRLLSRRLLHLGPQQVYWECNALKASETFPRGLAPLLWERVHTKTERPLRDQQQHPALGTKPATADTRIKWSVDRSSPRMLKDCQWIKKEGDAVGDSMETATMQLVTGNDANDNVKSKIQNNDERARRSPLQEKGTRQPGRGHVESRRRAFRFQHGYTPGDDVEDASTA